MASVESGFPNFWIAEVSGSLEAVETGGQIQTDRLGRLVEPFDVMLLRRPLDGGPSTGCQIVGVAECEDRRPHETLDDSWLVRFGTVRVLPTPLVLTRSTAGSLWTLTCLRDQGNTLHGVSPRERALISQRHELAPTVPAVPPDRDPQAVATIDEVLAVAGRAGIADAADAADAADGADEKASKQLKTAATMQSTQSADDWDAAADEVLDPRGPSLQMAFVDTLVELVAVWPDSLPWMADLIAHRGSEPLGDEGETAAQSHRSARSPTETWSADFGTGWSLLDGDLEAVAAADVVSRATADRPVADERHLTAALLYNDAAPNEALHDRLLAGMERNEADRWRAAMGGTSEPRPFAPINGDQASGEDALGRMPDVLAFAQALTSRNLAPPLAVGVFGDWGSGKSFFMRKLQEQIQIINNEVHQLGPGVPIAYCERVAQVEFNAWHYVETDLWASLIHHLLANLEVRYGPAPNETKQLTAEVIERLGGAEQSAEHARESVVLEEQRVARAEQATKVGREQLEQAELEAARFDLADVIHGVAADQGATDAIAAARQRLGLDAMGNRLSEVSAAADEAVEVVRRGWALFRLDEPDEQRQTDQRKRVRKGVTQAAIIAVVALAVGVVLELVADSTVVGGLVAFAGELVAAAQVAATWLRRQTERADAVVSDLAEAQATLREQERKETADARDQLKALIAREQEARNTLAARRAEEAAAQVELAAARAAAASVTIERRLIDFVDSRTDEYQARLGLVTSIRRDFRVLERLLAEWRFKCDRRRGLIEATPEDDDDDQRAVSERLEQLANPDQQQFGGLDRLIVYIDDLDRCPPKKVVKVLEAVHLLLAFDFIVVVVGVDARWVGNALRSKYPLLLGGLSAMSGNGPAGNADRPHNPAVGGQVVDQRAATEHDYLEKIFQIPYWLEPMDRVATGRLIGRLFGPAHVEHGDVEEASAPVDTEGDGAFVDWIEIEADGVRRLEEYRAHVEAVARFDPQPTSLLMTQPELDLLPPLHDLIGRSPRSSKRFVNVYRVLRASLDDSDIEQWVPAAAGQDCDSMAVLLLLALICGVPHSSAAILAEIDGIPVDPTVVGLQAVLNAIDRGLDEESPDEQRRWAATRAVLVETPGWQTLTPARVQRWLARAAQYSFRSGHLDFARSAGGGAA